jgi:glycosyltransferase involved in cell wall biosynthesis
LTVISILMLTHNRKGMVMRCLRSLGIEHPAVEWIILDNASTDGTAQFLLDTAREHGRMRVYLSGENKGVSGGRDWLLQQVNSDTLVFLDSDVVALEPHWLEKLVEPLESPATGLCGPGGNWVTPGWKWYEPVAPDYRGLWIRSVATARHSGPRCWSRVFAWILPSGATGTRIPTGVCKSASWGWTSFVQVI